MDFQRVFLFLIFTFSAYILWDGWQKLQNPVIESSRVASTPVASTALLNNSINANSQTLKSDSFISNKQEDIKGETVIVIAPAALI